MQSRVELLVGDGLVENNTLKAGLEPLDGIILGHTVLHAHLQLRSQGGDGNWQSAKPHTMHKHRLPGSAPPLEARNVLPSSG